MKLLLFVLVAALAGCADGAEEPTTTTRTGTFAPAPALTFGGLDAPLRPGASLGGYCTFNFVFQDGSDVFIGTAGHCTEMDERIVLEGYGEVGTVVFDSDEMGDARMDFSLILLDEGVIEDTNPTMLGRDGPTGVVNSTALAVGDLVGIHGYGAVFGDQEATRDREGVLTDFTEEEYHADMPAVPGDSGAPLLHLDSGMALGIISRFNFESVPPSTDIGPLVDFILRGLADEGLLIELVPAQTSS